MGCLSGMAKYILFFFNFLIVVCAIVLIAIGGVIIANESQGIDSFTDYSVGGFAIAVGVIIFFIAFFGCCGAIKENGCMLLTYAIILIVLLILQIVLGSLAFVALKNDDGELDKKVNEVVEKVFNKYFQDRTNDKRETIDNIQEWFNCCGVHTGDNWWSKILGDGNYPDSCLDDDKRPYKEGCAEAFKDAVTDYINAIGIIAIVFAVVEFVGAAFAFIVRSRK